jgi:16S rRNA G1207 methylase RsmC
MAHRLRTIDCVDDTRQADFLECNGDLGTFDRIIMNPPFANADDIKHIMHALKMLKPGADSSPYVPTARGKTTS